MQNKRMPNDPWQFDRSIEQALRSLRSDVNQIFRMLRAIPEGSTSSTAVAGSPGVDNTGEIYQAGYGLLQSQLSLLSSATCTDISGPSPQNVTVYDVGLLRNPVSSGVFVLFIKIKTKLVVIASKCPAS